MILRGIVLAVLIGAVCGFGWLLFRDTPQKQIQHWRQASEFLFQEIGDLQSAEELNARILEFLPESVYDRFFKAQLSEKKGSIAGLQEALSIYDQLLEGNPKLLVLNLYKVRVLRVLERFSAARGVA